MTAAASGVEDSFIQTQGLYMLFCIVACMFISCIILLTVSYMKVYMGEMSQLTSLIGSFHIKV